MPYGCFSLSTTEESSRIITHIKRHRNTILSRRRTLRDDEFTWRLATESCKLRTTSQQARSSCKPSQSICTCLTYIREDMQAKPRYDRSTCIYMHHMQASRTCIYVHDHASDCLALIKQRQASKSSESDEHVTCTAAPTPVETFNIVRQPPRPSREHLIS